MSEEDFKDRVEKGWQVAERVFGERKKKGGSLTLGESGFFWRPRRPVYTCPRVLEAMGQRRG